MNAPERAAWLEARRTGIGGSDVAAILALFAGTLLAIAAGWL